MISVRIFSGLATLDYFKGVVPENLKVKSAIIGLMSRHHDLRGTSAYALLGSCLSYSWATSRPETRWYLLSPSSRGPTQRRSTSFFALPPCRTQPLVEGLAIAYADAVDTFSKYDRSL